MRRKVFAITAILAASLQMTAGAYIDLGNGQVQLEDGESYGSVAAAFDLNYYNLGYYNGQDPDSVVVHAGDVISLGTASAQSYYNGWDDGSSQAYSEPMYSEDAYGYTVNTNWQNSQYYGQPAYNEYSEEYYYEEDGLTYSGYQTLTADGSYVDYGTITNYESSVGSASVNAGYTGNAGANVARACELNNQITIPAGGIYAASKYLGAGDESMGFVEATCLNSDGTTFQAAGGGICPVTTTIYQAGRDAGLEVTKRSPHIGGECAYAPDKEDQAMYNAGTSDLVMVNPYDYPITLNCTYIDGVITATFTE